ncbi:unnamed protein product [Jaminaea pallidilutea]
MELDVSDANDQQPESSRQAQERQTIYSQLHRAQSTLAALLHRPQSQSKLHLLDSETVKGLSASSGISRDQLAQVLSRARQAAKSLSQSISRVDSLDSTALQRYATLLKEQSQNISRLESATEPLLQLQTDLKATRHRGLPALLYVGSLSTNSVQQGDLVLHNRDEAVSYNAALSSALESLAKGIGFETFAEAPRIVDSENKDVHTHTLTQGGRTLVFDFELGLTQRSQSPAAYRPTVQLKLSLTTEQSAPHLSPQKVNGSGRHAKLTELIRRDAEAIALVIFACDDSSQVRLRPSEHQDPLEQSLSESRLRQASALWSRLSRNLESLAEVDRMSSAGGEAKDLLSVMHDLHQRVDTALGVPGKISEGAASDSSFQVLEHASRPFTTVVLGGYDRRKNASTAETRHLDSHNGNNSLTFVDLSVEKGDAQADPAPAAKTTSASQPAGGLPNLPQHLTFVAQLHPPLLVPRSLASALGEIFGLTGTEAPQRNAVSLQGQTASLYEDQLAGLFGGSESVVDASGPSTTELRLAKTSGVEALLISSLPLQSLDRFGQALTVLRQCLCVANLVTPLVTQSKQSTIPKSDQKRPTQLKELLRPRSGRNLVDVSLHPAAPQSSICLTSDIVLEETLDIWQLRGKLETDGIGWRVEASLHDELQSTKVRRLDSDAANALAHKLQSGGCLAEIADALMDWAQSELVGPAKKQKTATEDDKVTGRSREAMDVDKEVSPTEPVRAPHQMPKGQAGAPQLEVDTSMEVITKSEPGTAEHSPSAPNTRRNSPVTRSKATPGSPTSASQTSGKSGRRRSSQQSGQQSPTATRSGASDSNTRSNNHAVSSTNASPTAPMRQTRRASAAQGQLAAMMNGGGSSSGNGAEGDGSGAASTSPTSPTMMTRRRSSRGGPTGGSAGS